MTNYSIRLQKSREQFGKKVKFYSNTAVKKTNYGLSKSKIYRHKKVINHHFKRISMENFLLSLNIDLYLYFFLNFNTSDISQNKKNE